MSRSVKKSPVCTDHHTPGTRWMKRRASKTVRRFTDDVQNGKWYRKLFCSWNICDYRFYKTNRQAVYEWRTCSRLQKFTEADIMKNWRKHYNRK